VRPFPFPPSLCPGVARELTSLHLSLAEADDLEASEEDEGFDLVSRAEAALALPDDHFLEQAAKEAPTQKQVDAAATLE